MKIIINSIKYNRSLVDGPGIRTVLFLQGCNVYCKGCHNKSTWDIKKGKEVDVKNLADELKEKCFNKKLTISGGEPLMQEEAVLELLKELNDFDIALYTSHSLDEINKAIIEYLKYVKTGRYDEKLRTTVKPYVGSNNQVFMEVSKIETIK